MPERGPFIVANLHFAPVSMSENNFGKLDLSSGSAQTPDILMEPPPSYVEEEANVRPRPTMDRTSAFAVYNHSDPNVLGPRSTYYTTPGARNPEQASTSEALTSNSPLATRSPIVSPISFQGFSTTGTPSQFTRPAPPGLPYTSFNPIFVVAKGETLDKGFHHAPPPSDSKVHPFATHDIMETDWLSFLNAITASAALSEKEVNRSWQVPIISAIPVLNSISAAGVQKIMKSRKGAKVARLIDSWNHYFFEPRKLRIILMKGQTRLNGHTETAGADWKLPPNILPTTQDDIYRLFIISI